MPNAEATHDSINKLPAHAVQGRSPFALAAIMLGFAVVLPMFLWALAGPVSSGGGSGLLNANGIVVMTPSRPDFTFAEFALIAFLACLVSLILGLVSLWRRERMALSLCALSYGLTPVLMYLFLGPMLGAVPVLSFTLSLGTLTLYRKMRTAT